MSTASQLSQQGITKMRLPHWNKYAYIEVPSDGPWVLLFDLMAGINSGEPIPTLLIDCDKHDSWEPITS